MRMANQSGHEVHHEVARAPMSHMFNLGDVFQLVVDRFDWRTFPRQDLTHSGIGAFFRFFRKEVIN
jgi:hypothetical protein